MASLQRPSALEGYTQPIANDRGHLLPGVPRSKVSPWGEFMGTWDMEKAPLRTKTMKSKATLEQDKSEKIHSPTPQQTKAVTPPAVKTPDPEPQGVRMASPVAVTARTPSPKAGNQFPLNENPVSRTPTPKKTPEKSSSPGQKPTTPCQPQVASPQQQADMA